MANIKDRQRRSSIEIIGVAGEKGRGDKETEQILNTTKYTSIKLP